MMGIGLPELMIILVIIMIIFGAGKLPEIGSAFGNSIKNFKKSMKEAGEGDEAENAEIPPSETHAIETGPSELDETPQANDPLQAEAAPEEEVAAPASTEKQA